MLPTKIAAHPILRNEALGFSLILGLVWAAEILGLPHYLYGDPAGICWTRVLLRTLVVAAIWLWVHVATSRLIKRLHHLEEFLRVCSWCKKVGHQGAWLTTEEFFGSKFSTQTTHGICEDCAKKTKASLPTQAIEPRR